MKTGIIISGTLHVLLLLLAVLRLPFFTPEPPKVPQVTEVTLLTAAELADALRVEAPEFMADMEAMFQPTAEANDAERPDDAVAPEQTEIDVTEAPSERDADADLSAVLIPVADPDVEVNSVVIAAPSFEAPESPTMGSGLDGNSSAPTLNASPVPRSAPRVDAFAAPVLPSFDTTSDRTVEETTPDEIAPEPADVEPVETQPDAVAEILPEAQEDGSDSAAPARASTPPRRSNRIAEIQAEIEAEDVPVEEPTETVEDVVETEPEPAPENSELDDLIAGVADSDISETTADTRKLTEAQQRTISSIVGTALQQTWNKQNITGKPDFERLIINVEAELLPDGTIVPDSIRAIDPANPTGDFLVAYEAARRALLRAGRFDIPTADIPEGLTLTLTFDPSKELAGLN